MLTLGPIFHRLRCEAGNDKTPWPQNNHSITADSHPNKQMGIYQAVFIPSESVQEATRVFLSSERQNKETQTEETIVHAAARGHIAERLPSRMALQRACTAGLLEAGRILKLFFSPRVDRRIQGSRLTWRVLTKSSAGSATVPCLHAELRWCGGWTAGEAQSSVALWGFSRLITLYHKSIVILKRIYIFIHFFYMHVLKWQGGWTVGHWGQTVCRFPFQPGDFTDDSPSPPHTWSSDLHGAMTTLEHSSHRVVSLSRSVIDSLCVKWFRQVCSKLGFRESGGQDKSLKKEWNRQRQCSSLWCETNDVCVELYSMYIYFSEPQM